MSLAPDDIAYRIRALVADQFGRPVDQVQPTTRFSEDLDSDSLDSVELVMDLEDAFELFIGDDEIDAVQTVAELIDLVAAKVGVSG